MEYKTRVAAVSGVKLVSGWKPSMDPVPQPGMDQPWIQGWVQVSLSTNRSIFSQLGTDFHTARSSLTGCRDYSSLP